MPNHSVAARIDAVITWVDGDDPQHRAKRLHYQPQAPRNANAVNPHRWACNDELGYCLRSIANHAPWIGRIWIITDAQTPDLSRLPADLVSRIAIIDHRILFAGYESALPTFNSLAIETVLWRIPGLAEHFVYFNDDVFLTGPLAPGDLFCDGAPVLRGAAAVLECGLTLEQDAGDHVLFIGRVLKMADLSAAPLVFHGGHYHMLGEVL